MRAQKFNPDILQITHCQTGRYECEFANHTVAYLPTGYFSVATTAHLPTSFSFPLGKYYGVSLVIDRQALSDEIRRMMRTIPIDLDKIGTHLVLKHNGMSVILHRNYDTCFPNYTQPFKRSLSAISKLRP